MLLLLSACARVEVVVAPVPAVPPPPLPLLASACRALKLLDPATRAEEVYCLGECKGVVGTVEGSAVGEEGEEEEGAAARWGGVNGARNAVAGPDEGDPLLLKLARAPVQPGAISLNFSSHFMQQAIRKVLLMRVYSHRVMAARALRAAAANSSK